MSTPVLTLIPADGNVSGAPGTAAGWGFNLSYSASSDWIVLTGSQFTGSPVYGTYIDYLSLPNAPLFVAGPSPESSTLHQIWNPSSSPRLGIGEFDLNPTALPGATLSGEIVVHYSVFSQDPNSPNFDPDNATVIPDATVAAAASVNISPEPASLCLVIAALATLGLAVHARRRMRIR